MACSGVFLFIAACENRTILVASEVLQVTQVRINSCLIGEIQFFVIHSGLSQNSYCVLSGTVSFIGYQYPHTHQSAYIIFQTHPTLEYPAQHLRKPQ